MLYSLYLFAHVYVFIHMYYIKFIYIVVPVKICDCSGETGEIPKATGTNHRMKTLEDRLTMPFVSNSKFYSLPLSIIIISDRSPLVTDATCTRSVIFV